jgi:hypothetical protein
MVTVGCIIVPIYTLEMNYALSVGVLFWVPAFIMLGINRQWMARHEWRRPFWLTNAYLATVLIYHAFSSPGVNIWDYTTEHHTVLPLLGVFDTAPVEEFVFCFGAMLFSLMLYISFFRLIKRTPHKRSYSDSATIRQIAWLFVGFAFLPILRFIRGLLKRERVVSWLAILLSTMAFCGTLAFVEVHAVQTGQWLYNPEKTLHIIQNGILKGVAIEEFFQYYILGPIFVAFLFHLLDIGVMINVQSGSTSAFKPEQYY